MDFNESLIRLSYRLVAHQTDINFQESLKIPNTAGSFYELHGEDIL